ncbi:MAG: hypothetical protein ACTSR2_01450 [Candidatus Hodarchaeales archaeon]
MDYDKLWNEIKRLENIKVDLDYQIPTSQRDKTGLNFRFKEVLKSSGFKKALIEFDAYHGYFGYSGCTDDMSEMLAKYIVKALNYLKKEIIKKAKLIIDGDKKKLTEEAKIEAQKIIELVGEIDG